MIASLYFFSSIANLVSSPISVIVIGGGPTGLGAAIEAKEAGSDVILVEKRSTYTRQNTLFLYPKTLEILAYWNADIPLMERLEFKGERRGFVLIKDLEESLSARADELGVQRIQGEFMDFLENSHTVIIHTESGNAQLHYDVLVGADGSHSKVREKLGIGSSSLGEARGGIAMVPAENPEGKITAEIQSHVHVIAKRVCVPSATILFMQNQPDTPTQNFSRNEMIRLASEMGWQEEAMKIEDGGLFEIENIFIPLQRSVAFSDPARDVILLGDAAAAASFYQGTGANFSFKTTQLAKDFFANWPHRQPYEQFNRDMETEVNGLIATSLPLFTKKSTKYTEDTSRIGF